MSLLSADLAELSVASLLYPRYFLCTNPSTFGVMQTLHLLPADKASLQSGLCRRPLRMPAPTLLDAAALVRRSSAVLQ